MIVQDVPFLKRYTNILHKNKHFKKNGGFIVIHEVCTLLFDTVTLLTIYASPLIYTEESFLIDQCTFSIFIYATRGTQGASQLCSRGPLFNKEHGCHAPVSILTFHYTAVSHMSVVEA
jgi:hypothetical protein